jgi:hypothetical protein
MATITLTKQQIDELHAAACSYLTDLYEMGEPRRAATLERAIDKLLSTRRTTPRAAVTYSKRKSLKAV